jgi:hypothetical protein
VKKDGEIEEQEKNRMRGMIMMNSEALNTKQKLDFLIGL